MNLLQSFQMAIKNIASNKLRSLLTMLGIIIGVAAVTVIVGLGNGMENYMTESFQSMGTNLLTVNVKGRGSSRSISVDEMYTLAAENPDLLQSVSPLVSVSGTVKIGSDSISTTSISGVGEDYAAMKDYSLQSGRFIEYIDILNRHKVCVIGSYLAKEYFNNNALGETLRIGQNTYTIVGILSEEAASEESSSDDVIYLPYSVAAKLSWMGINSYTFSVTTEETVSEAKALIENALYKVFGSDSAYTVISLSEMLTTMSSMLDAVVLILGAIAAISLVVGGIGIMNIMLVSVSERTKEIGIRKALGAKQRNILEQFVIEAGTTSGLGGLVGVALGYALSTIGTTLITSMLDTDITIAPSTSSVLIAFAVSVSIGILFGYLPAQKAARLNPIEALRYD